MNDVLLLDLISGTSGALDYVSTAVTGHHRRVGIAAALVGDELNLDTIDVTDLLMAGLLHDIGAFSLELKLDGLEFDADLTEHADMGYRLLKGHPLLERISRMVRYHHSSWKTMHCLYQEDENTCFLSNIINLTDRVDVLAHMGKNPLGREAIRQRITESPDTMFAPMAVEVFLDLSARDRFWEQLNQDGDIREVVGCAIDERRIPHDQLLHFSTFFSHIIDFRSRHTATHSQGVAETAVQLAKLAGMSPDDQLRMRLAGNLHDIGKLAVPTPLLDKPAQLEPEEYGTVQYHAEACHSILGTVPGLDEVADWACQHHERVNGSGYPHGIGGEELSLGSRIMAVADVFTAITEDRPYRDGMTRDQTWETLTDMVEDNMLDKDVVALLLDNLDQIDAVRRIVQSRSLSEFKRFRCGEAFQAETSRSAACS